MLIPPRKVLIVGAGVSGVSAATAFSRAGHDVTVMDVAGGPATGVTSLGSGGFRRQFPEAEETLLAAATLAGWERLEHDESASFEFHRTGYLLLATGSNDLAALEQRAEHLRAAGIEHRLVDGDELRALAPGLSGEDLAGDDVGLFTPGDAYTSPPSVVRELVRLASARGVRFRFETRVLDITTAGDEVRGAIVQPAAGGEREEIFADVIVNAAGLRVPEIGRLVGDELPVRAWRQHQFRTRDLPRGGPDDFPCIADAGESLYFRPDGAGALVGYHDDAEAWAEDYTPTALMAERCATALARRWPALAEAGMERHWVGCYEVTPDWRALIGLSAEVRGSAYLGGFSGHGLMNSIGAAEELRRLVDGEDAQVDLRPFSAERFAPA